MDGGSWGRGRMDGGAGEGWMGELGNGKDGWGELGKGKDGWGELGKDGWMGGAGEGWMGELGKRQVTGTNSFQPSCYLPLKWGPTVSVCGIKWSFQLRHNNYNSL